MTFDLKTLLLSDTPDEQLRAMHKAGTLDAVLPALTALDINDEHSHRHKNNFYHSVQVLRNAIDYESAPDVILRTAALLHDVGKVSTRRVDKKGNPTFISHENAGARMIRNILAPFGYTKNEILLIEELVANHMRSYAFNDSLWTDSAVRRFKADLTNDAQLQRLIALFKSDLTTKNDKMRGSILRKIGTLEKRIEEVAKQDALAARRPAIDGVRVMEITGLVPGRELGSLMKFLNSEEGLLLTEEEAIAAVLERTESK